jgi:hypothetical protein
MKEAMKQALEALEDAKKHGLVYVNEIVDLRQAIAEAEKQEQGVCPKCRSFFCDHTCKQEQGEPVSADDFFKMLADKNPNPFPAQQRKPLTEEEAFALVQQDYRMEEYASAAVALIRRTEAAHGIKENNTTP